jgi:hypothetical protein
MTEARVEALVQAMATMTPPPVGQTSLTTEQQTALNTTIAAAWAVRRHESHGRCDCTARGAEYNAIKSQHLKRQGFNDNR